MLEAYREAVRIVRKVEAKFAVGPGQTGSAFLSPITGKLITSAHVVRKDDGQTATQVVISGKGVSRYESQVLVIDRETDLAALKTNETTTLSKVSEQIPELGAQTVFAGLPQGVSQLSTFPGIISAVGSGLISFPRCEMIQIAGMINNGNSGGPLLNEAGEIIGIITAKNVPLLREIDKLRLDLEKIPQFPSAVGINGVDFSAFVNMTIQSMWQISAVLRLVQVGVGWAVPSKFFKKIGAA